MLMSQPQQLRTLRPWGTLRHPSQAVMSEQSRKYIKFGVPIAIIVLTLSYLAFSGIQESKSYYVAIAELNKMGNDADSKRLRVAGNVEPGSIKRQGTHVDFMLNEQGKLLAV